MAKLEDDNKKRLKLNVDEEQEPKIVTVYKGLESILNNKTETYPKKVYSLIAVWEQVAAFPGTESQQYMIHLMDWLKLHTLNIVFNGDWTNYGPTYQEPLLEQVLKCEIALRNSVFAKRCQKLAVVIREPWGNPILKKLLNTSDLTVGQQEMEYFASETGYVISTRLRKLCDSTCEDLALNLVTSFMKCQTLAQKQSFNLNATDDQRLFILDIYIALLHKFKRLTAILSMFKTLSLEEGYSLLKRFTNKRVTISRIWRCSTKISCMIAHYFLTTAVVQPAAETNTEVLEQLLDCWLDIPEVTENRENLITTVRTIVLSAETAVPMYTFCWAIFRKFGSSMKGFIIELFVRTLNTDINDLEKEKQEENKGNIKEITKRLSQGFMRLGEVLDEHVRVSRECLLTSFSIDPTKDTLDKIIRLAQRSGLDVSDTGQDWKCKFHPPTLPSDEVCWMCNDCGDYMTRPEVEIPMPINVALTEAFTSEDLGISAQLSDDLVVVLSSQRYQLMNWLLRWDDLYRLCMMYLNDPERTKNLVTELKYLEIDYSMFDGIKVEPVDEYYGIERGYEQFLDDASVPDEGGSLSNEIGSDLCEDAAFVLLPPTNTFNSSPEVRKSLRSFRPPSKKPKLYESPLTPDIFPGSSSSQISDYIDISMIPLNLSMNNRNQRFNEPTTSNAVEQCTDCLTDKELSHRAVCNELRMLLKHKPNFNDAQASCSSASAECSAPVENSIVEVDESVEENRYFSVPEHVGEKSTENIHISNPSPDHQPEDMSAPEATVRLPSSTSPVAKPSTLQADDGFKRIELEDVTLKRRRISNADDSTNRLASEEMETCIRKNLDGGSAPRTTVIEIGNVEYIFEDMDLDLLEFDEDETMSSNAKEDDGCHINGAIVEDDEDLSMGREEIASKNVDTESVNIKRHLIQQPSTSAEDDCIAKKAKCSVRRHRRARKRRPYVQPTMDNYVRRKDYYMKKLKSSKLSNPDLKSKLSPLSKKRKRIPSPELKRMGSPPKCPYVVSEIKRDGMELRKRKTTVKIKRSGDYYSPETLRRECMKREAYVRLELMDLGKCSQIGSIKLSKLKKLSRGGTRKISENKSKSHKRNKEHKSSPLQDVNPKVVEKLLDSGNGKCDKMEKDVDEHGIEIDAKMMNARVILDRLDIDTGSRGTLNPVLANVPGLGDLQMIRPSSVDRIVQVVQVTGTRSNNTLQPSQSHTQTSTQITPHIQRIGQPKIEKPESSDTTCCAPSPMPVPTTTLESPRTESSSLINVLSQQIIRPGNQGNCTPTRQRSNTVYNFLSHQIIKPASTTTATTSTADITSNNVPRVISGGEQILGVLPMAATAGGQTNDQNHIVRLLCKSTDGKFIPVLSSNKVVKVALAQNVAPTNTSINDSVKVTSSAKPKGESAEALPKFQQAFGKTAYQNNIENADCSVTSESELDKASAVVKFQPKNSTTSLNVQPVQGGVIYTRQVPVGQTINLLPSGRGQLFRIASSTDQISLVKDPVIHSKMSALLAAALQGNKRPSDSSTAEEKPVTLASKPTLIQNSRIVGNKAHGSSNVIRNSTSLSSTTLEQLREFDMVYKQVTERSTNMPTESGLQAEASEPQQTSVTYLNQEQKICSPVLVVNNYTGPHSVSSPALSITSQGSSSPCVTPSPSASALSKSVAKTGAKVKPIKNTLTHTHTSKASPIPKPQQKPQEDEQTTQRIFDILAEYAEQLRNSPDLNNKPAPRRRSNPPTNPSQNTKRKKSSSSKKTGQTSNSMTPDEIDDTRTVGSEDSSCGLVQIKDEEQISTTSLSEPTESSVSPKQLILTEATSNQSRNLIITDSSVGEALKMSNTAVLVPGNYIMPVSMVKGGQQIAVVSGGSKILATVPARSGPNMLLFQSFLNQTRKHPVPTVKYSTVQPISGIARVTTSSSSVTLPAVTQNVTTANLGQSLTLQKLGQVDTGQINKFDTELLLTIAHPQNSQTTQSSQPQQQPPSSSPQQKAQENSNNSNSDSNAQRSDNHTAMKTDEVQNASAKQDIDNFVARSDNTTSNFEKPIINTPIATSVIAQTSSIVIKEENHENSSAQTIMALNLNSSGCDKDSPSTKNVSRIRSVLVATGTSNGPMLSHSPPQIHSSGSVSEQNKDEFLRTDKKANNDGKVYCYPGKNKKPQSSQRLDKDMQLQRKQAALEREIRLQKTLSEECEDLGVSEPSSSELFPEADIYFDHSPSYDQSTQDLLKRVAHANETKEVKGSIGLFTDVEPLHPDFIPFDAIEELRNGPIVYNDLSNGQPANQGEDHTLLQTSTSMADVTIPSPLSSVPNPSTLSTVPNPSPLSPVPIPNPPPTQIVECEEESTNCEGSCPSGRSARKSVRKKCSCCKGLPLVKLSGRSAVSSSIVSAKRGFAQKKLVNTMK